MTRYVTIEGTDGSGKTTLFNNLYYYLAKQLEYTVLETKEFGSKHDKACQDIRSIILNSNYKVTNLAMQLGFASIIAQHHEKVINPARESGTYNYILSDRGIDSNYAYAPAHGLDDEQINNIFDTAYRDFKLPEVTIFLNIDPELAFSRRRTRDPEKFIDGGVDAVEAKGIELQYKVRENFLEIAKGNDRIKVIDVTPDKTPEDILNEALLILGELPDAAA